MAERQQEYKEKLQGLCDLLTQTENRLISQQEAFVIGDGTVELKKYQTKQEVDLWEQQLYVPIRSGYSVWKAPGLAENRSGVSEARHSQRPWKRALNFILKARLTLKAGHLIV